MEKTKQSAQMTQEALNIKEAIKIAKSKNDFSLIEVIFGIINIVSDLAFSLRGNKR